MSVQAGLVDEVLNQPRDSRVRRAAAPPQEPPPTVIRSTGTLQWINVRELWRFRELLYFLSWRDVKVRYKQTVLGAAWAILQPAMMMIVFTVFFSHMANVSSGWMAYPLFVYAGLLPWTFFAGAITSAGNSVVGSDRLITKVYFPRLAIPLASVAAAAVDFLVGLGLLVALLVWHGVTPGPSLLAAPLILAGIAVTAAGVGTLLAALNVAYRDFRYVIPFMMQLWMFSTPAIYLQPSAAPPTGWRALLLAANPMNTLVASFRASVCGGPIAWPQLGIALAIGIGLLLVGCFYFRSVEDGFADRV